MTDLNRYAVFETGIGWIAVLASNRGLRATTLPLPTPEQALAVLGLEGRTARPDTRGLTDLVKRLRDYLGGQRVDFPDDLEIGLGTPFQQRVWAATRLIPYGETRSYRWVAGQIGSSRAARAVGQALGRNPLPIVVPCHRVIASDGRLVGFGGGLAMKRHLLEMERAWSRSRPSTSRAGSGLSNLS
jgi:methylated-DNA-[protein]-cysteine S-methyltransferase